MNTPTLHRGKLARAPRVLGVRPLTREDLGVLREKRAGPSRVKKLRAHHHRLAYMLASGMSVTEAAAATGLSQTRIRQLQDHDPAFQNLMAEARPDAIAAARRTVDEFHARFTEVGLAALELTNEHLQRNFDRLEVDPDADLIPLKTLLPLFAEYGDRFGYGKHTSQTNKVVDIAKVIEQVGAARGVSTVIDAPSRRERHEASKPAEDGSPNPPQATLAAPASRRRL